jgi:hypothetical protein
MVVGDDALNPYDILCLFWHPGDAALNCSILMLRIIELMLRMSILYILYKEGACVTIVSCQYPFTMCYEIAGLHLLHAVDGRRNCTSLKPR